MRILFTSYYNGFGVEIRSPEEIDLLYHMGCFGKGSASRSRPNVGHNSSSIMRRRQFLKRTYWHKKFGGSNEETFTDDFLMSVDALTAKILSDSDREKRKDVIDLVSSDEDITETDNNDLNKQSLDCQTDTDMVVIVPNSDSEGENYFENLHPKCCLNKIKLQEKLMLTVQEAFFLVYGLGCLQVLNAENKVFTVKECWQLFCETDANFVPKYVVYHYFRSKGYIVKSGLKFGGEFLLYKEGPGFTHANIVVVIKNIQKNLADWTSILGHVRMASTTVKEILIVEVLKDQKCEESKDMPQELLSGYSVREILLSRNIPATINTDID